MPQNNTISIRISIDLKNKIDKKGVYGESFSKILERLLKDKI